MPLLTPRHFLLQHVTMPWKDCIWFFTVYPATTYPLLGAMSHWEIQPMYLKCYYNKLSYCPFCRTVECLGILTGAQLFSLNKEELKAVCGDEGGRVFNQVSLQKGQLEVSHNATCLKTCFSGSHFIDVVWNLHTIPEQVGTKCAFRNEGTVNSSQTAGNSLKWMHV